MLWDGRAGSVLVAGGEAGVGGGGGRERARRPTRAGPTRAGPGRALPLDPPAGAAAVYVSCVFAPRRAGGPAAPPRPRAGRGRVRPRGPGCRLPHGGRCPGLTRSGPAGRQVARPVGVLLPARPGPLPPTELKGSVGGRRPKPRGGSCRPANPAGPGRAGPGRAGPVTGLASCGCRRAPPADPFLWSLVRGTGRAGPGRAGPGAGAGLASSARARGVRPRPPAYPQHTAIASGGGRGAPSPFTAAAASAAGPGRAGPAAARALGRTRAGPAAGHARPWTPGGDSDDSDGRDSDSQAGPARQQAGPAHHTAGRHARACSAPSGGRRKRAAGAEGRRGRLPGNRPDRHAGRHRDALARITPIRGLGRGRRAGAAGAEGRGRLGSPVRVADCARRATSPGQFEPRESF
jgi:hypothetical protein